MVKASCGSLVCCNGEGTVYGVYSEGVHGGGAASCHTPISHAKGQRCRLLSCYLLGACYILSSPNNLVTVTRSFLGGGSGGC